jgi:hypothetical protein
VLVGYYKGKLDFDNRKQYFHSLVDEKSSAELGEPLNTNVISIDNTATTASVKLANNKRFVSY